MIESPVLQEFLAESQRKSILLFLIERFGAAAHAVVLALNSIKDQVKLDELTRLAAKCPDLDSFEKQV